MIKTKSVIIQKKQEKNKEKIIFLITLIIFGFIIYFFLTSLVFAFDNEVEIKDRQINNFLNLQK